MSKPGDIHASAELLEAMRGNPPFFCAVDFNAGAFEITARGRRHAHGTKACNPDSTLNGALVWAACCGPNHSYHPNRQRIDRVPLDTAEDDYRVTCEACLLLMRAVVVELDPVRWDYIEEHGLTFDQKSNPREKP